MRKVSVKAAKALIEGKRYRSGSTQVKDDALYLHGHKIAWRSPASKDLFFCNFRGWATMTTKDRLNALANELGFVGYPFHTKDFQLMADGIPIFSNKDYILKASEEKPHRVWEV